MARHRSHQAFRPPPRYLIHMLHLHPGFSTPTNYRTASPSPRLSTLGLAAFLITWLCGACENEVAYCTPPAPLAVLVAFHDATSGLPRADSATGVLRNTRSGVLDTLFHVSAVELAGGNQLGTYDLVITRPGYTSWSHTGIVVNERGPCGNTIPVQLDAALQRTP